MFYGPYQSCYIAVAAAGKRADRIARRLLTEVVRPLLAYLAQERIRSGSQNPYSASNSSENRSENTSNAV